MTPQEIIKEIQKLAADAEKRGFGHHLLKK